MIEEYIFEWATSNVLALVLLFLCWKHPKYGRYGFGIIFLIASVVNTSAVLSDPYQYLWYQHFVILDIYGTFIEGFFSRYIKLIVLGIALGQLVIFIGLFYGKFLLRPALIGAMIFSTAIIPLGLASGMPAPLIMILALWLLYSRRTSKKPKSIIT